MGFLDINNIKDKKELAQAIESYSEHVKKILSYMPFEEAKQSLISEYNYYQRYQLRSCIRFGNLIHPGDICYIDFGRTYLQEIGYQHFGLVVNVYNAKAFVIPMTSNYQAYYQAYDRQNNPNGSTHLMRVGKLDGLVKYSVLFLNDCRFINTARIIEVVGHLDKSSKLFKDIRERLYTCLQDEQ